MLGGFGSQPSTYAGVIQPGQDPQGPQKAHALAQQQQTAMQQMQQMQLIQALTKRRQGQQGGQAGQQGGRFYVPPSTSQNIMGGVQAGMSAYAM